MVENTKLNKKKKNKIRVKDKVIVSDCCFASNKTYKKKKMKKCNKK